MKVSFAAVLLALISTVVLPSFAAPVHLLERDEYVTLEGRWPPAKAAAAAAEAVIGWMKIPAHFLRINSKPIVFYSGFTITTGADKKQKQVKAYTKLKDFKAFTNQDFNTIFDVIRMSGQKANWDQRDKYWGRASRTLAEQASGTAKAILGKTIDEGSVWITEEKPALLANPRVTTVEHWEIQANGSLAKMKNIKG